MEIWSKSFEPIPNCSPTRDDIVRLKNIMNGKNFLRKPYCIPKYIKKKLKNAEISIYEHALIRWNKRVGPHATAQELSTLMKQLIRLNRVCFAGDDYGYIDNDILFIYEWTGNKEISIITFYGRISMNICLQNFTELRRYNKSKDVQLKLDLSAEDLKKQVFPIVPVRVIRYFINWKKYELSIYIINDEKISIFIEQGEGVNSMKILTEKDMIEIYKEYPEIEQYVYLDT